MWQRVAFTLLRHALGYRDCAPEAIEDLVSHGRVQTLVKGETLVRQGEAFPYLCLVVEGSLEVSVMQREGRRLLAGFLGPGDLAGIMSLWDGLGHPQDMQAREAPTRVLLVERHDYAPVRDRHPSLARALELQMAYRSRLLHERLTGNTSRSLDKRLARLLHLMAMVSGRRVQGTVQIKVSQADIGDFLGVSRQSVNLAVQQLKADGLIEMRYSLVTIAHPERLAERAGL